MEFSFGDEYKDGPLALGLHKKNSTYDIVQMDDCYIVNDDLNKIVKYTVQFCKEAGLPYYKKDAKTRGFCAIWLSDVRRQMAICW